VYTDRFGRGGLPDAVGNAGLKFKRGDVDALVQSIQKLINSSALQKQLKEAADLHVAAHHPRVIATEYLKIIEAITPK
jgi:glycosyltransferase involved in cell wall biosynthesis